MALAHQYKKAVLISVLAGHSTLVSFSAHANEKTDYLYLAQNDVDLTELSLSELMQVEVFSAATLSPIKYNKAPGTVYKFDSQDLKRLGIRKLEDLMLYIPGVQLNQYRKRHRSIWSRGVLSRYNDKMVFMVDGIERRSLYYGHFSLGEEQAIENIERVEIIIGPASSVYGANAFSGLISITTKGFSEKQKASASIELADNDRSKVSASFSNAKFQVFGSYLDQEAPFDDERMSFIGGSTKQPNGEFYGNLSLKTQPIDDLVLSLDYQKNKTPFLYIPKTQQAFVENTNLSLALDYHWGDIDSGLYELKAYYRQEQIYEFENEQDSGRRAYEESQDGVMAKVSLLASQQIADAHQASIGVSWDYRKAKDFDFTRHWHWASGFYDAPRSGSLLSNPTEKNHDLALFVQDIWHINEQWDLTLGARYDKYDAFGGHFNYRSAVVYTPNEEDTFKFLFGTATRTPTYREYLKVLDTDFVAPVPDPETIRTIELAYSKQWYSHRLSANLYHNKIEDTIVEVPTPDDEDEYFANSNTPWKMTGLDLMWQFKPQNKWHFQASLGYVDAKTSGEGKLPYIAKWTASAHLDYNYWGSHHVGLGLVYNSNRADTNRYDEDDSDSFHLVNLQLRGDINSQFEYRLGIDNVFDEKVYDPSGDFGSRYNNEQSERVIWGQIRFKLDKNSPL